MLKQRIITALVLLAFLLPALFYSSIEPFAALSLLMIVAGGWEWARLNGCSSGIALCLGFGLGLALAVFWLLGGLTMNWHDLWLVLTLMWTLLAVVMLRRGVSGWSAWPEFLRLWLGLFLIACAWLAMVQARQLGLSFLLSLFLLVWMADIAAYFGGKAFGRHKLAPTISPGKSWEGVFSGMAGVAVLALGWLWAADSGHAVGPSVFMLLWAKGPVLFPFALVFLVGMSVAGDLVESLVKRGANVKDSSQLLPGHGGVLDRVDALLPLLPLGMMIATI